MLQVSSLSLMIFPFEPLIVLRWHCMFVLLQIAHMSEVASRTEQYR